MPSFPSETGYFYELAFIKANEKIKRLVSHIRSKAGVFGVLGNHDCIEIAPELEDAGIIMLINDAINIQKKRRYPVYYRPG